MGFDGLLKVLVAVTCVAVLAGGGWFILGEKKAREEAAREKVWDDLRQSGDELERYNRMLGQ